MPHYTCNYPKNSAFFSINIYTWFDFEFIDMSCSDERQIFEENGLCYGVIETADDIKKNGNTNRFIMNCLIFRISLICDSYDHVDAETLCNDEGSFLFMPTSLEIGRFIYDMSIREGVT